MSVNHTVLKQSLALMMISGLFIYFLWMDIALYHNVQHIAPVLPNSKRSHDKSSSLISPFTGLSVKMMMMDPINNYILTPIAQLFNYATSFSEKCYVITPNMISFTGLVFAGFAARCVVSDNIIRQRIAVLLFQGRTWCDALDGIVARARMGMVKHASLRSTPGYVIDGLADTLGFTAFLVGCYYYLRRWPPNESHYRVLSSKEHLEKNGGHAGENGSQTNWTARRLFYVVFCFGMQIAVSAFFWDRYIHSYSELLETPQSTVGTAMAQNEQLKSAFTWMIMWFWRVCNAHCLIQFLLIAIVMGNMWMMSSLMQTS
ncbi:ceramide phosphoethanolamine synthase-like isoform X2 [Limulus polyphemus]|uniref:Ceramide phosphoethanolamine synthase-like isoform X2 n=1 Tax=Limulus polyphemus TaxID=6850 RepID=A0ABM1THV4_LIMPO|nr:ceramide phosphoethanolamine synthase-like isoform X2 [Limulus polyphemus]